MPAAGKLLSLLCVGLVAALVLAACGEDEELAATSEAEQASASTEVEIVDFEYLPETISVSVGDTVTWTNFDEAPHTSTADDDAFDTGDLELDDTGEITFEEPGSYPYYCRFHAFMRGTVEVK